MSLYLFILTNNFIYSTYEVATACALAIEADKLICIVDGQILDKNGRHIRFMTLQDADLYIRKRAKQSETAANYVKFVGEDINSSGNLHSKINGMVSWKDESSYAKFQNGVGFDNGKGQGFAIGGQERLSRLNGYFSELAAAAFVCKVMLIIHHENFERVSQCTIILIHDNQGSFFFFFLVDLHYNTDS